jgi:hypothetical protein
VNAVNAQTAAVERQNEVLKRADHYRLARERLQMARMLDASLQVIEEVVAAKGRYHTDNNNHLIDRRSHTDPSKH